MLRPSLVVAGILASGLACAAEPSCRGLVDLQRQLQLNASSSALSWVGCGSITSVVKRVLSRPRKSGRQLEADTGLNVAQAQANVDAAQRSPDVRAKLERAAGETQDETLRLFYEAAIYDEEGFYAARDLRIQQVMERLK